MNKTISIRPLMRNAWRIYTKHFWVFATISAIQLLIIPNDNVTWSIHLISFLAVALLALISAKVSIMAVDGKEISWSRKDFFPTPREYLKYFLLIISVAFLTLGGFILLIIPGFYVVGKSYFSVYAYVASGSGNVSSSIRESWDLVKGKIFWKVLLWVFISIVINGVGMIALWGIGLLITAPITWLTSASFFRELQRISQSQKANIVEQPKELT